MCLVPKEEKNTSNIFLIHFLILATFQYNGQTQLITRLYLAYLEYQLASRYDLLHISVHSYVFLHFYAICLWQHVYLVVSHSMCVLCECASCIDVYLFAHDCAEFYVRLVKLLLRIILILKYHDYEVVESFLLTYYLPRCAQQTFPI